MTALPWISAEEVFAAVDYVSAVEALRRHLATGPDPATDPARSILDLTNGQLLLMPSESADAVGVKVATVAPGNAALGLERIQGIYLLMDAQTLTPAALLDGTALTTLRTPAVSAAAASYLAPETVDHLVVFGSGPQAQGHVEAMYAIRPFGRVSIVARHAGRAQDLVDRLTDAGFTATLGTPEAVRDAQLIVCATTARTPLFDGSTVPTDSCTIAVGSHEPGARELDSALMTRAQVVVEDVAVALREAGDVLIPRAEGVLSAESLVPLRDLATGEASVDHSRPRVFKSSGMSWEDLVIAEQVLRARSNELRGR
ncbi:ornithine cyclodeaminase family protein [Mycetocola miduiensis]|uniref:Ornithine cyclodeaminase n=1 Tax=Mycetocola miduiensis TaxID=995034 RepID=A0A1I5C2E5_9MICO|nr:ornithine cyclodeaminase [Mycetocola miduiensis]SFN81240.1 ornithine cyclodeaminase [Mycetocola miduiensis]